LSTQEGIAEGQWCYVPNDKGVYGEGMKVKANALNLSGYRLPTEWEWEVACSAGSVRPWSMGAAEDLLPRYAWYDRNSGGRTHPVGSLRPNDWGLFDMHGNISQLCHNRIVIDDHGREQAAEQRDGLEDDIGSKTAVPVRGGVFAFSALATHSAHRSFTGPANRAPSDGFWPARTFP
jgi:formylglycine-generating enzyme required for sulfatase activity